jgi:hypothetical protein
MAELLAILLIAAVVSAVTKPGRNFIKSAHKATGWRTPRAALHHYSGRAGHHVGRGFAGAARHGRRGAGLLGRQAASTAGRRWQARWAAGEIAPPVRRTAPPVSGSGDGGNQGMPPLATAVRQPRHRNGVPGLDGSRPDSSPASAPTGDQPGNQQTGAPASAVPATAPAGAQRKGNSMATRYSLNLEPPTTDGEFLESCVQLGDVLKSLAEEISNWADGLGSLNLPQSVLNPLHQVSDGITDAADGATQAATAFEDEFEDARDVAARGMHFTGQDAA